MTDEIIERIKFFTQETDPKICAGSHQLIGTGVFYQSVGLIQCNKCKGWQAIRKPVRY